MMINRFLNLNSCLKGHFYLLKWIVLVMFKFYKSSVRLFNCNRYELQSIEKTIM